MAWSAAMGWAGLSVYKEAQPGRSVRINRGAMRVTGRILALNWVNFIDISLIVSFRLRVIGSIKQSTGLFCCEKRAFVLS